MLSAVLGHRENGMTVIESSYELREYNEEILRKFSNFNLDRNRGYILSHLNCFFVIGQIVRIKQSKYDSRPTNFIHLYFLDEKEMLEVSRRLSQGSEISSFLTDVEATITPEKAEILYMTLIDEKKMIPPFDAEQMTVLFMNIWELMGEGNYIIELSDSSYLYYFQWILRYYPLEMLKQFSFLIGAESYVEDIYTISFVQKIKISTSPYIKIYNLVGELYKLEDEDYLPVLEQYIESEDAERVKILDTINFIFKNQIDKNNRQLSKEATHLDILYRLCNLYQHFKEGDNTKKLEQQLFQKLSIYNREHFLEIKEKLLGKINLEKHCFTILEERRVKKINRELEEQQIERCIDSFDNENRFERIDVKKNLSWKKKSSRKSYNNGYEEAEEDDYRENSSVESLSDVLLDLKNMCYFKNDFDIKYLQRGILDQLLERRNDEIKDTYDMLLLIAFCFESFSLKDHVDTLAVRVYDFAEMKKYISQFPVVIRRKLLSDLRKFKRQIAD